VRKHDDVRQARIGKAFAVTVLVTNRARRLRAVPVVGSEPGYEIGDVLGVRTMQPIGCLDRHGKLRIRNEAARDARASRGGRAPSRTPRSATKRARPCRDSAATADRTPP